MSVKKWVRNIGIGMALGFLKDLAPVKKVIEFLKTKKVWVGRAGLLAFTVLAAVKYYYPTLPIDDSVEILGIVFSWLALEIGLNQSEVDKIKEAGEKPFDPSQPISLDGIDLPSPESIGITAERVKAITSDSEEK